MIKVTYIGMLATNLKQNEEEVEWSEALTDVADLIDSLCERRAEVWSRSLRQKNLLISVNHSMVKADQALSDGDEVILFPPMSGG